MNDLSKRSAWFCIGETLVDESKGHITAEQAIVKIREYMRRLKMEKSERTTGKWIPCAEHLPKEGDLVLLWDADRFPNKEYVLCEFRENYGFYNWNEGTFIAEYDGANAWMPLPEPWKGEE